MSASGRQKHWWPVSVVLVIVLLAGLSLAWWATRLRVSEPFDVQAFLDPGLFAADRAPSAYRNILPLIELFNAQYPGTFDRPRTPKGDPDELLAASADIAAQLVKAGSLAPGFWQDPRIVYLGDSIDESSNLRWAGRILVGRAHLLLAQGRPQEALEMLLASTQLGRHAAYRGPTLSALVGIAIESLSTRALGEWAVHDSVSPEMILSALATWRTLKPSPPRPSDMFKGEYVINVRGLRDPFSIAPPEDRPDLGVITTYLQKVAWSLSGVAGERAVSVHNALIADRLSWCDRPAWERRQWTMTVSGPSHLAPAVPGVELSRDHLDSLVNRAVLISLLLPSLDQAHRAFDRTAQRRVAMETHAALVAYFKRTGRYPDSLQDLVPDYLAELPPDPFSGKPLGYAVASRDVYEAGETKQTPRPGPQPEWLKENAATEETPKEPPKLLVKAGGRILYSIGPDGLAEGDPGWLSPGRIGIYVHVLPAATASAKVNP